MYIINIIVILLQKYLNKPSTIVKKRILPTFESIQDMPRKK